MATVFLALCACQQPPPSTPAAPPRDREVATGSKRLLQVAPPSNDDIANATVITSLPFTDAVDVSGATGEEGEPAPCGFGAPWTIWYTYTAATDERLVVSTVESTAVSAWAAYSGTPGALEQITCADSSSGEPTRAIDLQAGSTIYIQTVMFSAIGGTTIALSVRPPAPAPTHDDIDAALPVAPLPFSHTLSDFLNATAAADDPQDCNGSSDAPSVWYRYANEGASPARIAFSFGGGLTNLDVYTGTRGSLAKVVCNTPFYPVQGFNLELQPGESVLAALTKVFGYIGAGTIRADVAPAGPPNDAFGSPRVLTLDGPGDVVDLAQASLALDDPPLCTFVFRAPQTAWWTFTATQDGEVEAALDAASIDAAIGVFTGERGALQQIACQPGAARFIASAGETYQIMVGALGAGEVTARVRTYVPFQASLVVDPVATLDRSANQLTITGKIVTNKKAGVGACGQAEQPVGKRFLVTTEGFCVEAFDHEGEAAWTRTVPGSNGILAGGKANVRIEGEASTRSGESQPISVSTTVRVNAGR